MSTCQRRYLVRREETCLIVFDRHAKRWEYRWKNEWPDWALRDDAQVIDYSGAACHHKRPAFGAPLALFLDITSRCQYRCWYCYNESGETRSDQLSTAEICALIAEFARIGGMELRLSGGEPTLHPDLPELLELADRCGLRTILVSNGHIVEERLAHLAYAPVSIWFLSLQGDESTHDSFRAQGSYRQCLHTAETLLRAGKRVRLSMVCHKRNRHCIEDVARTAARIGAAVAFNPLHPFGRATSEYLLSATEHRELVETVAALRRAYSSTRIDTPWIHLADPPGAAQEVPYLRAGCGDIGPTITAVGDYYTCGQLCSRREFRAGNIRDESFHAIWLRTRLTCPIFNYALAEQCLTCPYMRSAQCSGGCPAMAFAKRGLVTGKDPYCYLEASSEPPRRGSASSGGDNRDR